MLILSFDTALVRVVVIMITYRPENFCKLVIGT